MLTRNVVTAAERAGQSFTITAPMAQGRWAVPVLAAVLSTFVLSGCGRPVLHCGNTVTVGDQDTFLAAMLERGGGVFSKRLEGVEISFRADEKELARARTNEFGYAVAIGRIPAGARTFEARTSLDGQELVSQGNVLVWDRSRTIVVCDIDGTISDTDFEALVFDRQDEESQPLPGAAETLQRLSGQYNLIFLTGRPVFLRDKTNQWLENHGFPPAPAVHAPNMHAVREVEYYKQLFISKMKQLYPNALIGIGNAETDSQAYTGDGMLAIMIDDGEDRRFRSEAIALRTWDRVGQFFDANTDLLADPSRLRAFLSEGGLLLYPQQPIGAGTE